MQEFYPKIENFLSSSSVEEIWKIKTFQKFRQYLNSDSFDIQAVEIAANLIAKKPRDMMRRSSFIQQVMKLEQVPNPNADNNVFI